MAQRWELKKKKKTFIVIDEVFFKLFLVSLSRTCSAFILFFTLNQVLVIIYFTIRFFIKYLHLPFLPT